MFYLMALKMSCEFSLFLGGGFKQFLFSAIFGEMIQIGGAYFSNGLNPPTRFVTPPKFNIAPEK